MDLQAIETKIKDAVHNVLGEVEQAEPTIEQDVYGTLVAVGTPQPIAGAINQLLIELWNHFHGQAPAPAAQTGTATGGNADAPSTLPAGQITEIPQPVPASQLSS
jgi:hypothetical protein